MTQEEISRYVEGCRQNDRTSQIKLYEHLYGLILHICRRYVSNDEEAKELVNDTFIKAFTKINSFEVDTNFKAWISKIAQRVGIDRFRAQSNIPKSIELDDNSFNLMSRDDLKIVDKLDVEDKIKLLQKMSPMYRNIINLYVIEEYTHEEISDLLGISVGTSKSNLFKARKQLIALIHLQSNSKNYNDE